MAFRCFLLLSLTTLLIFSAVSPSFSVADVNVDDEDLSFLEDPANDTPTALKTSADLDGFDGEDNDSEIYEDEDDSNFSDLNASESDPLVPQEVDEKAAVVLKERNLTDVIENNRYVMVEFYALWCGHCQALALENAAAATELKAEGIVLAKVDAMEEKNDAYSFSVLLVELVTGRRPIEAHWEHKERITIKWIVVLFRSRPAERPTN